MRDERQIKERIEIYQAQIENYEEEIERLVGFQNWDARETYRAWIRKNLDLINELKWTLG